MRRVEVRWSYPACCYRQCSIRGKVTSVRKLTKLFIVLWKQDNFMFKERIVGNNIGKEKSSNNAMGKFGTS